LPEVDLHVDQHHLAVVEPRTQDAVEVLDSCLLEVRPVDGVVDVAERV